MKKRNLWLAIPALALVFGMMVIACDNASGGGGGGGGTPSYTGTADGWTYKLQITSARAAVAKEGDAYTLTASKTGTPSKTSNGTVESFANNILTLKPSNGGSSFTVTISGNNITSFTGSVKWDGEETPTPLPDELTPPSSLNLSGQVYEEKWNDTSVSYQPYTGDDLTFTTDNGVASGTIKGGKLSLTLETPASASLENLNAETAYFSYLFLVLMI